MSQAATYAFAYHQLLVVIAGAVCLFGTWVGMRHFARARATAGHDAVSAGCSWPPSAPARRCGPRPSSPSWRSTRSSTAASSRLRPASSSSSPSLACLVGFEIGSRHFTLAPEAGGLVMGAGILAMHFVAIRGWHIAGTIDWNVYGVAMTFVLGLGLERARGQPRQPPGDALVPPWRGDRAGLHDLRDALRADGVDHRRCPIRRSRCPADLDPGAYARPRRGLRRAAGDGQRLLDLCHRPALAHGIGRPHPSALVQRHHDRPAEPHRLQRTAGVRRRRSP